MSRLPIYSPDTAPEDSRPLIEKVLANNGFIPNLIGVLAGSPQALETYLGVGATNARGSLSLAEREVVQLTAARIHGCGFCVAGHTAIVLKNKVFDKPDALALHYGQALSDPRLQGLAEFTAQVIATRGAVPNTALQAFLDAGYTERQALEVVLGVSLATLCNFANNLAQTEINPQLQGFAVGALGEDPSAPATPPANTSAPWLAPLADALDERPAEVDLLGKFADDRLTRIGVPQALGGEGGSAADVAESIAALAEQSLAASFVLWSHRSYTEFVVNSDNPALRERELPDLLAGRWAGAVGMSNAMKFVCGIESLGVTAQALAPSTHPAAQWRIDGRLPWVTNLRSQGFSVAAAAQLSASDAVPVFAFRSDQAGVQRSKDLELIGLRGSDVAAIQLDGVAVGEANRLHADLNAWLPQVRPQFLGFQCGMSVGLARASLAAAQAQADRRPILQPRLAALGRALEADAGILFKGLENGRFQNDPGALFRLRIALAQHVQQALSLELQAWGGRAYLNGKAPGFERRWREAAFIPIITPSLAQLEIQLQLLEDQCGATANASA